MDSEQNGLQQPEPPEVESVSTAALDASDGPTESVRRKLDVLDVQDAPEIPPSKPATPLKEKFSDLNSKLISYVNEARKTELMLAESERKCKNLEEKLIDSKQECRKQIEVLRAQLDQQIRASVLSEEQRQATESRFGSCHKQLKLATSICETQKDRLDSLEQAVLTEKRRLSTALEELVSLREQVVRERAETSRLRQELTTLSIEHAKLKERWKINAAALSMHQRKLDDVRAKFQYTAADVEEKLAEQKRRLEMLFKEQLATKCQLHQNEVTHLKRSLETKLSKQRQVSAQSGGDFDLLKGQLTEQQARAQAAEEEASNLKQKLRKAEAEVVKVTDEQRIRLEQERRRREKLNQRLLIQSRAYDEIRLELDNYRKLMENVDAEILYDSPMTPVSPARNLSSRIRSPSAATGQVSKLQDERSNLLRRVLATRKRSLSGGSDSLHKVANKGDESTLER